MATEAQLRRYLLGPRQDEARRQRDVPKRQRPRRTVDPTKPLANPQATLGHAPRGRKGKGRR